MNCYLVVWPAKNGDVSVVTSTFPEHHPVLEGRVYMVAAKQKTCAEVCDAIGIGNGAEIGNGAKKSGLVTKVNDYYGLFDRALWEKMDAWREM